MTPSLFAPPCYPCPKRGGTTAEQSICLGMERLQTDIVDESDMPSGRSASFRDMKGSGSIKLRP